MSKIGLGHWTHVSAHAGPLAERPQTTCRTGVLATDANYSPYSATPHVGQWRAALRLFKREIRRFAGLIARSLGNSAAATTPRYGVTPRSAQIVSKYRHWDWRRAMRGFGGFSEVSFRGVLPPMSLVTSEECPLKLANCETKLFLALNAPTKALKNARIGRPFSKGIAQ